MLLLWPAIYLICQKKYKVKSVISSHRSLFFNVVYNELKTKTVNDRRDGDDNKLLFINILRAFLDKYQFDLPILLIEEEKKVIDSIDKEKIRN